MKIAILSRNKKLYSTRRLIEACEGRVGKATSARRGDRFQLTKQIVFVVSVRSDVGGGVGGGVGRAPRCAGRRGSCRNRFVLIRKQILPGPLGRIARRIPGGDCGWSIIETQPIVVVVWRRGDAGGDKGMFAMRALDTTSRIAVLDRDNGVAPGTSQRLRHLQLLREKVARGAAP